MEIVGNLRHLGLIRAHHSVIDPMASFEEIIRLQPWLNPGHKHQQCNPDRSKDNPYKVGAEKLNSLYGCSVGTISL